MSNLKPSLRLSGKVHVFAVVLASAALLFCSARPKSAEILKAESIETEGILLKSSNGKIVARLDSAPDGTTHLRFYDPKTGVAVLSLGRSSASLPEVVLRDRDGADRIVLSVTKEQTHLISMFNSQGKKTIAIGQLRDGEEGVALADSSGQRRLGLGVKPDGDAEMQLFDKDGHGRLKLSVSKEGEAEFSFIDANVQSRLILKMNHDGSTTINIKDSKGKSLFNAP